MRAHGSVSEHDVPKLFTYERERERDSIAKPKGKARNIIP